MVTYESFGEWLVPWRFEKLETEYQRLREGAALIDRSTQGLIEVQGIDRASFLHNLLTNDIKSLAAGEGCEAFLLNASAKLITDLLVLATEDTLLLLCDAARVQTLFDALDHYHFSEAVTLKNCERKLALLALEGPHAEAELAGIIGRPLSFKKSCDHIEVQVDGIRTRVIRRSLTSKGGLLCACPADEAKRLWNRLTEGSPGTRGPVGWEAWNIARIEDGIPCFGVDMDSSNLLPETGLEATTLSSSKGCYIGQEVIARIDTRGSASKRLVQLEIQEDTAPMPKARIFHNGEEAGYVTSACVSPVTGKAVALGYVKRGAYESGTRVDIEKEEARLSAVIVNPVGKEIRSKK